METPLDPVDHVPSFSAPVRPCQPPAPSARSGPSEAVSEAPLLRLAWAVAALNEEVPGALVEELREAFRGELPRDWSGVGLRLLQDRGREPPERASTWRQVDATWKGIHLEGGPSRRASTWRAPAPPRPRKPPASPPALSCGAPAYAQRF